MSTASPGTGDAYIGDWRGVSVGDGMPFAYDGELFYRTGHIAEQHDAWETEVDASCLSAHAATGDPWACNDRMHVLFHHTTTPFLFREDFADPTLSTRTVAPATRSPGRCPGPTRGARRPSSASRACR